MTAEQNLAMIRELLEAMRQHDVEKATSYYAEDCVLDIVPLKETIYGRDNVAAALRMAWTAFPDQYYTEQNLFASDDYVLFEGVLGGTQKEKYVNIPPTGKHIAWRLAFIWRIVDGKVQELRSYWDAAYLLRETGIIPPSAQLTLEGA